MSRALTLYQVDAFAEGVFTGNPAAVVPLEAWLPDETLLAIAEENNLSETAFFVPLPQERGGGFHLRWFTPTFEIDLCGHATLATAWVIFNQLGFQGQRIRFESQSGELHVDRDGDLLVLDFPAWPALPVPVTEAMCRAFGGRPLEAYAQRDLLCIFENEDAVRGLTPDHAAFHQLPYVCNIASAPGNPGEEHGFVSRVFCPEVGVPEDPVTGSAHCLLMPYWAARLGKTKLSAFQASKRGGRLLCELAGNRVRIAGRAALYLRGEIFVNNAKADS